MKTEFKLIYSGLGVYIIGVFLFSSPHGLKEIMGMVLLFLSMFLFGAGYLMALQNREKVT